MDTKLRDSAAACILRITNMPRRYYTADEMNYFMKQFPSPLAMKNNMKVGDDDLPILGLDMPVEQMGEWLLKVVRREEPYWPLYFIPLSMGDIREVIATGLATLEGYLHPHGLGTAQIIEDEPLMVRGVPVALAGMQVEFLQGVEWKG